MTQKEKIKKQKPTKKAFNEMLQDKYGIDLVDEYAKVLRRERTIYMKSARALKVLILEFDPDAEVEVTEKGNGKKKTKTLKVKSISSEAAKAFDRYWRVLEVGFRYAYPVIKAVEMKHDTDGKVAFNISIPAVKEDKK